MERDIGASELENWTLRDRGMAWEGCTLAGEAALGWRIGGGEEWEGRVAMIWKASRWSLIGF